MRLIGLYIYPETEDIAKVLKPGWFPFGNFPAPDGDRIIPFAKMPDVIEQIYSPDNNIRINVSAIVGKNGSGKSTLLDIFYRIINNFSIYCIGKGRSQNRYRSLQLVYGVFADLYYEADGKQYRIKVRNTEVFFEQTVNGYFEEIHFSRTHSNLRKLSNFFYTIATNYSLYAYDPSDYLLESHPAIPDGKDNSAWISGLFHKNDGYLTPIVLTPFRSDGTIQGGREKHLAEQRINCMAIMAQAHGHDFLPGYEAWQISVRTVPKFEKERTESLQESLKRHSNWMKANLMIEEVKSVWIKAIENFARIPIESMRTQRFNLSLFYLAYKSIKLASTYEDYSIAFHLEEDNQSYQSSREQRSYYTGILHNRAESLIKKIFMDMDEVGDEHNHLILKIEQTWNEFIHYAHTGNFVWRVDHTVNVPEWLRNQQIHTYSDLYRVMPPPFLKATLTFRKRRNDENRQNSQNWISFGTKSTLTLASMSSGERHLLYALSYVLYHLKNLQSVRSDANRMKYHNFCLVFDEIEMFLHPEYQRRFIGMLLDALEWSKLYSNERTSIQIIIATHSPFTLTDIFTHNTLYLKDGEPVKVEDESFGANYYDILANSFFFENSAIGEIASRYISMCAKEQERALLKHLLSFVGDKLIANYIYNQNERDINT